MTEGEKAGEFFDRFAETFDTFYEEKRAPIMRWIDRRFRRDMYARFARTFNQFGDLSGQSVLDIGCGSGVYAVESLRRGAAAVVAVDPAPGMLELLRQRLRRADWEARCTLVEGSFPGAALEPADHAIVMGVMDYVADPAAFLRSLRPLVRKSAAISFPSKHFLRTPLRKWRYWLRNCPVYFYDDAQIRRLCREAGFDEIDVHKIPGAGMDYCVCLRPQPKAATR